MATRAELEDKVAFAERELATIVRIGWGSRSVAAMRDTAMLALYRLNPRAQRALKEERAARG